MRLASTILWSIATLLWLPWLALLIRLIVDLVSGTPFRNSEYLNPALVPIWPTYGWLHWSVVSWWPIVALLAMTFVYLGWRLIWWEQDWVRTHSRMAVVTSIIVPPLSLILLYRDARRRFLERNARLEDAVEEALAEMDEGNLRLLR